MGGYYALRFKEEPVIATAIAEHYNPRFDGDDLPSHIEAVVIAIADRIDTMVACFENNAIPTGSRDPWVSVLYDCHYTHDCGQSIAIKSSFIIGRCNHYLDKPVGDNFDKCCAFL